jgi:hypothetical protein
MAAFSHPQSTKLDLDDTRVSDVSPLAGLTALEHLDLRRTRRLRGLSSLPAGFVRQGRARLFRRQRAEPRRSRESGEPGPPARRLLLDTRLRGNDEEQQTPLELP